MHSIRFAPQANFNATDALHNVSRLLSVESRPYQRVSNRLIKPDAFKVARPVQLPSPPPDASSADEEAAAQVVRREQQTAEIRVWQDDINNEISMLDYAVMRMELATNSNQAERERYAVEKNAITSKQQHVKDHIEDLRVQLKDAKDLLAVRKTYDELTEKITSSKMLKPRDEQAAAHAKLDEEIEELRQEVEGSKRTWMERRTQFGRIEEEIREMLRMIKDEKEEAERKEGMMNDGEDGEGSTTRGIGSQVGTPRPDAGNGTPMHPGSGDEQSQSLRPPQDRLASLSKDRSGAASPARSGVVDLEMLDNPGDSSGMEEEDGEIEDMDQS